MVTNIQVRSVDDALAQQARDRAAATHRSLSTYVKDLIQRDLEEARSHDVLQTVFDDIVADEPWAVSRTDVADALVEARRQFDVP